MQHNHLGVMYVCVCVCVYWMLVWNVKVVMHKKKKKTSCVDMNVLITWSEEKKEKKNGET